MLSFRRMRPEDRQAMEECLSKNNYRVLEAAYVTYFLWEEKFKYQICFKDGFLYIKYCRDGKPGFLCPFGEGDFTAAINALKEYCRARGEELKFGYLIEETVEKLRAAFPDEFAFTEDRDGAEYIYLAEKMITLAGKKLHSKRNFINRFNRDYDGRWTFDHITAENLPEIYEYENRWQRDNRTNEGDLDSEKVVIEKLLRNMDRLGSVGGILRLDGKMIGFSIGTQISEDTFDIQIEKADWDVTGAYQVLNNEFAKAFCADVTYINREDDMGLDGLRKAKLSYYPHEIIMKYNAVYSSLTCCVMDMRSRCRSF